MNNYDLITQIVTLIGFPVVAYFTYTFLVALMGFRDYEHYKPTLPKNRFAIVVAARNEANVIKELIQSLKNSNYPTELFDIWVLPNNCTDNTEEVARENGACIFKPQGQVKSKGEALRQFFNFALNSKYYYDAFCVFDADNIVKADFLEKMNDAIEAGEKVAQGYRDSKNPKDSWISGSQSMFYWVTNRFLNRAKRALGMSAVFNGTGFMVTREVVEKVGFNTYTMTEDIEFSTQCILNDYRIAFVRDAITYDEHPTDFATSWKQRKRWSTGIIQTLNAYSPDLFKKFLKTKKWINLDMIFYLVAPFIQVYATFYSILTLVVYGIMSYLTHDIVDSFSFAIIINLLGIVSCCLYVMFVTKFEQHKLKDCKNSAYVAFWWFITSWTFINIEVFFKPITNWEPIVHTGNISMSDLEEVKA